MNKEDITQDKIDALMNDIIEICKSHGLWLAHEDWHGGFLVTVDDTMNWLKAASSAYRNEHGN